MKDQIVKIDTSKIPDRALYGLARAVIDQMRAEKVQAMRREKKACS